MPSSSTRPALGSLAARRFEAEAAQQHIQSVRAEGLPKLVASGSLNRTFYYNPLTVPYSDNYAGTLATGFLASNWAMIFSVIGPISAPPGTRAHVVSMPSKISLVAA